MFCFNNNKELNKIIKLNKEKNTIEKIINIELKKLKLNNNYCFQRFLISNQLNKTETLYKLI